MTLSLRAEMIQSKENEESLKDRPRKRRYETNNFLIHFHFLSEARGVAEVI